MKSTARPPTIPVRNPRTGEVDMHLTPPGLAELKARCQRLREHQAAWEARGVAARIEVLRAWQRALEHHREPILSALCSDTGRERESEAEVRGLFTSIGRWCLLAPKLLEEGQAQASALPGMTIKRQYVPYPLVGVISPWNFPLLLSLIDAVPALLAGCAVVVKPSEMTPRFVEPLTASVRAVPELEGVLAYVVGDGATGAALIEGVDALCFTGSVATGKKVAEAAARAFVPVFLELGGKDPAIVLASAELGSASSAILWSATSNAGQSCQSLERIYVQDAVFAPFLEQLIAKARGLKLACEGGPIAPIITTPQAGIVAAHLRDAVTKGAVVHTGGVLENHGGGLWCRPTVITGVTHGMKLMQEETFGPILPVMPFGTVDEGVRLANNSEFGLSAAVFAGSIEEAEAVARRLQAGAISINDAGLTAVTQEGEKHSFGFSGMGGSRMGPASIKRFVRQKALIVKEGSGRDPWWFEELSG